LSIEDTVFWDMTPVYTASHLRERALLHLRTGSTNIWIKVARKERKSIPVTGREGP
jgi:hypothetical protein